MEHAERELTKQKGTKPSLSDEEILTTPLESLLDKLNTSSAGLSAEQAKENLETYGRNEIAKRERRTALVRFLLQFKNPLVLILLFAGTVSAVAPTLSGEPPDIPSATIIISIVVFSLVLTFFQESRAEKAADELRQRVATTATVTREGSKQDVRLSEVVPGDIVILTAGDIVPADARVISSKDFFVDQSTLTGESFPIEKTPTQLATNDVSSETSWTNYLFLGTSIVSGSAQAVVVRTGSNTEYGKIVKRIVERRGETEFEKGLRHFGYMIMEVTFLLVIFVFFVNAAYFRGVLESLLFSVALAVGLTPELLPMILTVNLSKGALAMSKRGVIVKRLSSIQNFGNMDILCTDKTGTLTENKVTLMLHVDVRGEDDEKVLLYSFLNSHFQTGLRSPLDEAILIHKEIDVRDYQKVDEVPFDFVRRRLSVVVEHERQRFFITKGAPEEIVKICSFYEVKGKILDMTNRIEKLAQEKYKELSTQGFRVLGIAYKRVKEEKIVYSVKDETEMVLIGYVAFMDPPKETAKKSIELLKKTGIDLKIVTGDNELVTRRVCEQLGFEIKGIVLGSDLAKMHDDALARIVEEANIFARVSPAQKDRIIHALRVNGHVVGYLGDGINDAPSMRVADVSISVENAVDVAKETADIILLQKDLTVLQQGVLEGRRTFGNTMKYIMMGMSSNFGNMFSAAAASLFLKFLPMLPTQILLNNLLYDISEVSIPTDNVDEEYIERPKRLDVSFIRNYMIYFGPISSIFDFLTFLVMIVVFRPYIPAELRFEDVFRTAWFIESLCTQTLVIFAIRTRLTPFYRSKPSRLLTLTSLSVVIVALILPFTPVGAFFGFIQPPILFLFILAAFVIVYILLVEIVKIFFYRKYSTSLEQAHFVGKAKR